ncbi:MAG: hypothetical protein GY906_07920 [bacterium]|nr:hypothetical protein [bacterium]
MRVRFLCVVVGVVIAGLSAPCEAGTQDFLLVNETGIEIYSLFISETNNDDWEEDVLDQDVLPHGSRITISFSGRSACFWDILVTDDEGGNVTWNGLNLCTVSTVILRCNDEGCWADYE